VYVCLSDQREHQPFQAPDHRVGTPSSFQAAQHFWSYMILLFCQKWSALLMYTFFDMRDLVYTHTQQFNDPLSRDYPGWPVPEETFTHFIHPEILFLYKTYFVMSC